MKAKKKPSSRQPPRPPVVIDHDDDDDDDPPHEHGEDIDLDAELQALDEELGADASTAKVVVHKIVPNGDSQRCFGCPRPQFFSDLVREQYGAGTYSVMVYFRGKLKNRYRLSFAEPVKPPIGAVEPGTTHPLSHYFSDSTLRDVETRFEQRLEREQARHFELLKLFAGGRPQLDPLQMQQQVLTMLATVKDLTGGSGDDGGGRAVDLILQGVQLAQKLGGAGEGTDWPGIIAGTVGGLRELAQAEATAQRRVIAAPTPQSTNGSAPPAPTAPAAPEESEPDMREKLRKRLQFLVRKAQQDCDPDVYAALLIDDLGELPALVQPLAIDYLTRPDCFERLMQLEPAIGSHREWFTACIDEIRRQLSEPNASEGLTPNASSPEAGT